MPRSLLRVLTLAGIATIAVLLGAGVASAHVTASADNATQGGFTVISFRVPTESPTASTVGLKVQFPTDQPLASVSVRPHQGWTYKVTNKKLATPIKTDEGDSITDVASVIEWRAAAGGGIKPGEFDEFQVSAGPLPKAPTMTFKAIQTYSDGKQVAWVEESAPGSTVEPAHPAPYITLAAAPAGGSVAPSPSASAAAPAAPAPAAPSSVSGASSGSVVGAYVLGAAGLVVGIVGLALARAARRRPVTSTPATVGDTEGVRTGVE